MSAIRDPTTGGSWSNPRELMDHIAAVHHGYIRLTLPMLGRLTERIAHEHLVPVGLMDRFERQFTALADLLETHIAMQECRLFPAGATAERTIPEGIQRSQQALRRALPELLAKPKYYHQWVAYHGEERIGIAQEKTDLIRECLRRGLPDDEYDVGWIDPCELIEEEEIELRPQHIAEPEDFRPITGTAPASSCRSTNGSTLAASGPALSASNSDGPR